ncbi:MAG: class I SAM-dependent methyltransferase, partial [Planctomycetota bacterium]
MLYISPYPQTEEIYETVAEYEYEELGILDSERHYQSNIRYYERFFPMVSQECTGAESLLDVGCGTGRLLELCGQLPGLRRVGIELNKDRAQFARQKAGCEIVEQPIQSYRPEHTFDVITLMNLFSHVPDLAGFFAAVRGLLSEHGKVILKVGELARDIKKSAVYDWQIPDHLQFLGLKTMDVLAGKFNFKITRHDREPLSAEMFSTWRWRVPGRSRARNLVKSTVAATPGALPLLRQLYRMQHG